MPAPDEPVDARARVAQLGAAYLRLPGAERERHAALLARVRAAGDVAVDVTFTTDDARSATLTLCAVDCIGTLSLIAGVLAAQRIEIVDADAFVLPRGDRRRGSVVLDRFSVRAAGREAIDSEALRAALEQALTLLVNDPEAARERVIERVAAALRAPEAPSPPGPLLPLQINLDADSDPTATVLTIDAADTPGFLFEFTNALALLQASVTRAEVRTSGDRIRDTFWLTDVHGQKITAPDRLDELRVAAALIMHFTALLPRAPDPAQALRQFAALARTSLARPDWRGTLDQLADGPVLDTLAQMLGVSRFLWEDFLRLQYQNLFPVLRDVPALDQPRTRALLEAELGQQQPLDVARLNAYKDRQSFLIDLRQITRRSGFTTFARELSDLADVVIAAAAALAHERLQARHGEPRVGSHPCHWAIGALGKWGGRELGFASDLELLFVYESSGDTAGPEVVSNAVYFDAFVRAVRDALVAPREGIFELDLRLRPYGEHGSLATPLEAFRRYYATGGAAQQFERMALVKLRPVAGDVSLGAELLRTRDAYVYSGAPLDIANIRHLRTRQATELVPRGARNAKYSAGGVVDIEYYVQRRQIEVGSGDATVREPSTLGAIAALALSGHLDQQIAVKMEDAYGFLRRLIDALRVVRGNARDLTIPQAGAREFAYLSRRLLYDTPEALARAIDERMAFARDLWAEHLPSGAAGTDGTTGSAPTAR